MRKRSLLCLAAFLILLLAWSRASFAGQYPQGAIHDGEIDGASIRWASSYELEMCNSATPPCRIELAIPMQQGYRVLALDGVRPIEKDGEVIALELTEPRSWGPVGWTVVQADGLRLITPPLAKREGWQIVNVHGRGDVRFEPGPESGLERRVGYFARPVPSHAEREEWSHRLGYERRRLSDAPMFVRETSGWERGIPGTVTTRAERTRGAKVAAAVTFAIVIAGLMFVVVRRSSASSPVSAANPAPPARTNDTTQASVAHEEGGNDAGSA